MSVLKNIVTSQEIKNIVDEFKLQDGKCYTALWGNRSTGVCGGNLVIANVIRNLRRRAFQKTIRVMEITSPKQKPPIFKMPEVEEHHE